MVVKGILAGKAKCEYKGLVRITEGSSNCEGYQQEDTLLLSKKLKETMMC